MSGRLDSARTIAHLLQQQPRIVAALQAVARQQLPDGWIGAGFVRAAVWDALHDRPVADHGGDVDVVYFDAADVDPATDAAIESALRARAPGLDWSVTNQARMHARNGDPPYRDTAHALTHWPETCTAIGARWRDGHVEILAPLGVCDLLGRVIRPTPAFADRGEVVRARVAAKRWLERWPGLVLEVG